MGQQQSFCNSTTSINDSSVPIAIAIQETIELTVLGGRQAKQVKPTDTRFEARALGNIKVAFPNSFARLGEAISSCPILKLRINSADNILRYYSSTLIKDLDSETTSLAESATLSGSGATFNSHTSGSVGTNANSDNRFLSDDLFDMTESPMRISANKSKIIEFDMTALMNQLTQMYQQAPSSRYYNLDVLRYQITPIEKFEQSPLQVNAYWKIEPSLIKLRVDFKHSNQASGFDLERLREVSFCVDMSNVIAETHANLVPPSQPPTTTTFISPTTTTTTTTNNNNDSTTATQTSNIATNNQQPHISFEPPQAKWNNLKRQLTWKFDNLLPYYKSDGFGSLLAKFDFRDINQQQPVLLSDNLNQMNVECELKPVEVKFMVADSTLSRIQVSIDSSGYRLPMLKKEIRTGRYKSEPYVF